MLMFNSSGLKRSSVGGENAWCKVEEWEERIRVQASLISSMTPKERADPDLVIRDKTALSRQRRISKGAGRDLNAIKSFVSDFQQMRTMMAKMAGQVPPDGPGDAAAPPDPDAMLNRSQRRAKKKKGGKKKRLSAGFG